MNKRHFHELLTRYRSGACTERETRLVDQWFALIEHDKTAMTDRRSENLEARLWQAIQSRTGLATEAEMAFEAPHTPISNRKQVHFFARWQWAAAVAFLLMALGGYQWYRQQTGRPGEHMAGEAAAYLVTKTNNTTAPMWLLLSDGSRVSLQPQATMKYSPDFRSSKREVLLKGKAFFEVARDERKPFLVYTGEITTKVLGTSFWVDRTEADSGVEISVVTGKVSVFQKDKEKEANAGDVTGGVVLSRNQSVRYTSDSPLFTPMIVKRPVVDDEYKNAFVFDDARLENVAQMLEDAYGIDIVLTNDRLKNCLFTADINKQPMFTQLDLIAASVNATYTVRGTRIYLYGKGCQ